MLENTVNYEGIESYWKDDYYFCEDKILANISNFFGCEHGLMFAGAFNFGYQRGNSQYSNIGNGITVKYFQESKLLEKYYGIQVHKYDYNYGAEAFLTLCKSELSSGRPVVVGLHNCGVWPAKVGEEHVKLLPFLIISVKGNDSVELIDAHELGIRRTISKDVFIASYRWGVSFEKKDSKKLSDINIKEFISFVMDTYHSTVRAEQGCMEIASAFPNISSGMRVLEYQKTENPYGEILMLAEDILTMDLEREVEELGSVLFVPFYFALLLLYRSRLVFTKAIREVAEYKQTDIFQNIIQRLVVASSKWNYLRMVFTNCYHSGKLEMEVKENMSSVIREIAEHEKKIIEEFQELYDKYDEEKGTYDMADISNDFNTYLFDHENWKDIDEKKSVYGRYYYDGKVLKDKYLSAGQIKFYYQGSNEKGDSLVCLGQTLYFDEDIKLNNYQYIALCGTVLYNEMIYDYMEILYTDGSKEAICIGFNGWIENEYSIESSGNVVWEGNVVKRESKEATDSRRKAVIYGKKYCLKEGKKVLGIILPNNPFINIMAISFEK